MCLLRRRGAASRRDRVHPRITCHEISLLPSESSNVISVPASTSSVKPNNPPKSAMSVLSSSIVIDMSQSPSYLRPQQDGAMHAQNRSGSTRCTQSEGTHGTGMHRSQDIDKYDGVRFSGQPNHKENYVYR